MTGNVSVEFLRAMSFCPKPFSDGKVWMRQLGDGEYMQYTKHDNQWVFVTASFTAFLTIEQVEPFLEVYGDGNW